MTKRSLASEDSDDDEIQASSSEARIDSPHTKKRRFVEFEPIRICSIGSVVCFYLGGEWEKAVFLTWSRQNLV
ncbi:unnamed protein product [Meloidogyne enterolobii]|uniref:Uncharacterized protein n=1 Tax=Meloidogyne enterolobii TaxID=390850 RepID=A0ACB1ARY6_MELEN